MISNEISAERKTYRLIVRDGDRKSNLYLTDCEAVDYINALNDKNYSFIFKKNEYAMKNLELKLIEDQKPKTNEKSGDQIKSENELESKIQSWITANQNEYNKMIAEEKNLTIQKLAGVNCSQNMINGITLSAVRIRIKKIVDPNCFNIPEKKFTNTSKKNYSTDDSEKPSFCLVDSYFSTVEIGGEQRHIFHLVQTMLSSSKWIPTGKEWYGVQINAVWKLVKSENGKAIFTGKILKS